MAFQRSRDNFRGDFSTKVIIMSQRTLLDMFHHMMRTTIHSVEYLPTEMISDNIS